MLGSEAVRNDPMKLTLAWHDRSVVLVVLEQSVTNSTGKFRDDDLDGAGVDADPAASLSPANQVAMTPSAHVESYCPGPGPSLPPLLGIAAGGDYPQE